MSYFRALSDPKRREILRLCARSEMSAGSIAEQFAVARSTLSGHLNVLKEAGLVVTERQGTTIMYSLNVAMYEELLSTIMDLLGVGSRDSSDEDEDGTTCE